MAVQTQTSRHLLRLLMQICPHLPFYVHLSRSGESFRLTGAVWSTSAAWSLTRIFHAISGSPVMQHWTGQSSCKATTSDLSCQKIPRDSRCWTTAGRTPKMSWTYLEAIKNQCNIDTYSNPMARFSSFVALIAMTSIWIYMAPGCLIT